MKQNDPSQPDGLNRRAFLRVAAGGCAALTSLSFMSAVLNLRLTKAAIAATPVTGYKALVCMFLHGGIDSHNLMAPYEDAEYDDYANARGPAGTPGGLALPKLPLGGPGTLLPITDANSGRQFGLHPGVPEMQQLFNNGQLAFVSNVGSLIAPVSMDDFNNKVNLPLGLFSHNDQQRHWQTAVPQSRVQITGWAGRMADLLTDETNSNPTVSMNIGVDHVSILQNGDVVTPYVVSSTSGAEILHGYEGGNVYDRILTRATDSILEQSYADLLRKTHAEKRRNSIDAATEFNNAIESVVLDTVFPPTSLGRQLEMVAKSIGAREALGQTRQCFLVERGGWDHHASLLPNQAVMLPEVSAALQAFYDATVELGVAADVTTHSISDFGRTLATNGDGSDHAWGGNHLVMGESVQGGRVYGEYPESLSLGNPLDTGRGRLIPTTSVDTYSAELALWFGLHNDTTLESVLPNIRNFYSSGATAPPLGFMTQNVV